MQRAQHRPLHLRRIGGCVLAALSLHAALGLGLRQHAQALAAGGTGSSWAHAGHQVSSPLQVRWVTLPRTVTASAAATPATVPTAGPALAAAATAQAHAPEALATATAATTQAPNVTARADSGNPASDAAADVTAHADTPSDGFSGYARRDTLDRGPQALGIVQIAYPPGAEPGRVHTGRLTLFIDETGTVRKVAVVDVPGASPDAALPPPFVEAAREAFLQAHFAPGERQGMAVKSRIDIEVSFDGREADPLEASRQPQDTAPAGRPV